jgi:hypothetical protein
MTVMTIKIKTMTTMEAATKVVVGIVGEATTRAVAVKISR